MTRMAVRANHNVSLFIRSEVKLSGLFDKRTTKRIQEVFEGDAVDPDALARAIAGREVVVECLGDAHRPAAILSLIRVLENFKDTSLIALGGTPALLLPCGLPAGPRLGMQPMAALHLRTLELLRASEITQWIQVCPSRMTHSPTGDASGRFTTRRDVVDLDVYARNCDLFFEDVALEIVNALNVKESGFSGSQMAFVVITPEDQKRDDRGLARVVA